MSCPCEAAEAVMRMKGEERIVQQTEEEKTL
jgi:hypothetical protein